MDTPAETNKTRCAWVSSDKLYRDYHDLEWGRPVYDKQRLFEFLILEGAQAGLSWITILKKRENYRQAFAGFDPERLAKFSATDIERLKNNEGIIRNTLKIKAAISNAQAYLKLEEQGIDFAEYIWQFVGGKPIKNHFKNSKEIPTSTELSDKMAKDLKKKGFKFVGSTICYAYMQAVGLVNDHTQDCFCY